MSSDRDTARIVRSWLEEGRTTLPDWVRDDVFDRLPATPQRRSRGTAWRFLTMPTAAKTAIAAAAVILVAVGALAFLQRPTGPGVAPTPSPTTAPTPTATPEPVSDLPQSGPTAPGTYRVGGSNILVTVPSGWVIEDGRDLRKNRDLPTELTLLFWRPDIGVHADACLQDPPPPLTGPTADNLLTALRAQESTDVSEPIDVTFGEIAAQQLTLSPSEGVDPATCANGLLQAWTAPVRNGNWFGFTGPNIFYVSETEAGRVVFAKGNEPDATAEDLAELDAMLESMAYEK
jgi:hypothetical protein